MRNVRWLPLEVLASALAFVAPTSVAPAHGAPYFGNSPFLNAPVPGNAQVDPRSGAWVDLIGRAPGVSEIAVNDRAWTAPVYHAAAGTPTASIFVSNTGKRITVPYAPNFRPSPDSDSHLVVVDDATGCGYEFQTFDPSTMTAVASASYHVYTGSSAHVTGPGHSGGEMSYLGGMITPTDVASGAISHALRLSTPLNSPEFVYPATRSDGIVPGGVPQGSRVQLDPALDLAAYGLTPFQTMVARAFQQYGAFVADSSESFAVSAQSTIDGSNYVQPVTGLPKSLLAHMRVLVAGVDPRSGQDSVDDATCQQQR